MYLYALHADCDLYAPPPTGMTPKRVHFAETNMVYSAPPTPSPTLSELSLPSSPDPPTPSLLDQKVISPYPPPLPPDDAQQVCSPADHNTPEVPSAIDLNDLLRVDLIPPLQYDINFHPSYITTTMTMAGPIPPHRHRSLSMYELAQPATTPPLPLLHLVAHRFPWTIIVAASDGSTYVTVLDVLVTIHRAVRMPVTQAEYDSLPTYEDVLRVRAAYEARFKAMEDPAARWEEERKGVKRVDFLLGRTVLGLSRTNMGDDFWLVNVE